MQLAKELLSVARAKGEQALSSLPVSLLSSQPSDPQSPSYQSLSTNAMSTEARVQRFKQELQASHINIHSLKRLAMLGIPEHANLRATVWKVLLGYLPPSPDEWSATLARRRTQYHVFCSELIIDPKQPLPRDHPSGPLAPSQGLAPGQRQRPPDITPLSLSPSHPTPPEAPVQADPLSGGVQGHGSRSSSTQATDLPSEQQAGPLGGSQDTTPPPGQQGRGLPAHGASPAAALSPPLALHPTPSSWTPQGGGAHWGGGHSHEELRDGSRGGWQQEEGGDPLHAADVTGGEHPLSLNTASRWHTFFQDEETQQQITRDVMRTHPDLQFFSGRSEAAELHRQELQRALFMYAKLNPGLCYIQGMNELIAPLYFLFKHDPDPQARQYAEADAFWCFMELISEFRDHFCAQLDNAQTGIKATIRRLMTVLQACDYKLWQHIEVTCKVDPQYYAFRWITLLLAQEFPFPDTLRTWDTILGDPHGRMDCLLRICTAMILGQKERLMQGDFTVIMKTLQRYPLTNLEALLHKAASLPSCKDILGSSP